MPKVNPHPVPTPLQKKLLCDLLQDAKTCYERQWNSGTAGNFSIRGSSGLLWQSPSGFCKGRLSPQDFIPVAIDSLQSYGPFFARPSDETPLHAAVYRKFKDARVVIHVHTPFITKASYLGSELVFEGHEMAKALGAASHKQRVVVPVVENTQNMHELAEKVLKMKFEANLLVLRGHGVYSFAPSSYGALALIEALEFLCQTCYPV